MFHQLKVNGSTCDSVIIDGPGIFNREIKSPETLFVRRSVETLKKRYAHVDRRIGGGTDCQNQLGIAVITVAVVMVVYIKLLSNYFDRFCFIRIKLAHPFFLQTAK